MRLLTVPNWSFGRDQRLTSAMVEILSGKPVQLHYLQGDLDHNRTVSAFSGEAEIVVELLFELCRLVLPAIDLNRHLGAHPRIGALDVCPFVLLEGVLEPALSTVEFFAHHLAHGFDLPVYLYERSEKGQHEADLPSLRRGGFGTLTSRDLRPDYGPNVAHPHWGISVVGLRDFLIAMNINLADPDPSFAKELAREARHLRQEGDPRFLGVRALGFPLASRDLSQLSFNLTLPDITTADPIIEWASLSVEKRRVQVIGTELIGVIRKRDLPGASRLPIRAEQVVEC